MPTKAILRRIQQEGERVARDSSGTANFTLIKTDGDKVVSAQRKTERPCHGDLFRANGGWHYIVTSLVPRDNYPVTYEDNQDYYEWLLNDSPWSHIFPKEFNKKINPEYPFVVLATNHPANMVVSACIATRSMWEGMDNIVIWRELVQNNIDPNIAYILCSVLIKRGGEYCYDLMPNEHWPISSSADLSYALNFVQKKTDEKYMLANFFESSQYTGNKNRTSITIYNTFCSKPEIGTSLKNFFNKVEIGKLTVKSKFRTSIINGSTDLPTIGRKMTEAIEQAIEKRGA